MQRFWRNNGLSLVLLFLFVITLLGQSLAGHRQYNQEQRDHDRPEVSYREYLASPDFLEVTMENWESEFLQMGAFVFLTVFLFQRGSAESKDPDAKEEVDRDPDPRRGKVPWPVRRGGLIFALYRNSLSLAFLLLFLASMALHAVGGARKYNEEQLAHGSATTVSTVEYLGTSQFWYESFQNWQSEFLAIAAMVILSIFLRQHGSPESKPVDASHDETGAG